TSWQRFTGCRPLFSQSDQGRANVMIQFVSQVFPPSSENACSQRAVSAVGRDHTNRQSTFFPFAISSPWNSPTPPVNLPTIGGRSAWAFAVSAQWIVQSPVAGS